MKEKINALHAEFTSTYPHVSVSRQAVEQFLKTFKNHSVHLLYDYILSQGLEDDIEI